MGINGLLKFLKPYVESVHIKKYAGKRVGIDAYSWLHKGAYSCSIELCLSTEGNKKFQYVNYFMHRINMLRHYNITPVVVFDGGNIPCKAATEDERHRRREANRELAMEKLKEGDAATASELFQRAVSITPQMAHQLIQILRSERIEFVVSPYEADAQLAHLPNLAAEEGGVVAVISEDSDLLAYCCPAVVFKMDRFGNGEEIVLDRVLTAVCCSPTFQKFNRELFTGMCVLAGCDFLPSIPGIGIVRAYNLVVKYLNFERVLSTLKFAKGTVMPDDYPQAFKEALAVFQHARIYDSHLKQLKHLKPLTPELLHCEDKRLNFLGPDLPPSVAIAIAEGNLDPCTMIKFDHSLPDHPIIPKSSRRLLQQERTTSSNQESCFTVISCQKAAKTIIKGDASGLQLKKALEEEETDSIKKEVLQKNEALALERLALHLRKKASNGNRMVPNQTFSDIPNNNPFKKRKLDQIQQDQVDGVDEDVSEVTQIENLQILCVTPESQKSIDFKPATITGTRKSQQRLRKGCLLNPEHKKNS